MDDKRDTTKRSGTGGGSIGSGASQIQESRKRDQALMALHKAGDERAFGRLFDSWFDAVYDRITHRGVAPRDAAAAETKVFASLWRQMQAGGTGEAFGILALRAARSESPKSAAAPGPKGPTTEDRLARGTDRQALGADRAVAGLLWDGADVLGDRAREVLDLTVRHGLSPDEIASVLGDKPPKIKAVLDKLPVGFGTTSRARILWRGGEPEHKDLANALKAAGATGFTPDAVRVINDHAKNCDRCRSLAMVALSPLEVFGSIPMSIAPVGVKQQVASALAAEGVAMAGSTFVDPDQLAAMTSESDSAKGQGDADGEESVKADEPPEKKTEKKTDKPDIPVSKTAAAAAAAVVAAGAGATPAAASTSGDVKDTAPDEAGSKTRGKTRDKGNAGKDAAGKQHGEKSGKSPFESTSAPSTTDREPSGGSDEKSTGDFKISAFQQTSTGLSGGSSQFGLPGDEPATSKLEPVEASGRKIKVPKKPPWKWIGAGAAAVVLIAVVGILVAKGGSDKSDVATGDTVLRSTTTTEDPSQTTTTTRASTTTSESTTTTTEDPGESTTTTQAAGGGGGGTGGGGGGTGGGGGGGGGASSTTTTTRAVQQATASITINGSSTFRAVAPFQSPTVTWSATSNGPISVIVSGPGLSSSSHSGSQAACPGSSTSSGCDAGVGQYYYNISVYDGAGTLIKSANAQLNVTPY